MHIFLRRATWLGLFFCCTLPAETKKNGIDLEKVLQQPAAQAVFAEGKTPELAAPAPAARPFLLSPELPIWLFSRRGEHKTRLTPHEVKLLQLFFFLHDQKGISLTTTAPPTFWDGLKKKLRLEPSAPAPKKKAIAPGKSKAGILRRLLEWIYENPIGGVLLRFVFEGAPYLPLPPLSSAACGRAGAEGTLHLTSPHLAHAVWMAKESCGNLKGAVPWGHGICGLLATILPLLGVLPQATWLAPVVGFVLQLIPTWRLWQEARDFLIFCEAEEEELDKLDELFYLLAGKGAGEVLTEWFYYGLLLPNLLEGEPYWQIWVPGNQEKLGFWDGKKMDSTSKMGAVLCRQAGWIVDTAFLRCKGRKAPSGWGCLGGPENSGLEILGHTGIFLLWCIMLVLPKADTEEGIKEEMAERITSLTGKVLFAELCAACEQIRDNPGIVTMAYIFQKSGCTRLVGPTNDDVEGLKKLQLTVARRARFLEILWYSAARSAMLPLVAQLPFFVARALFVAATSMVALAALKSSTALRRRLGVSGARKKDILTSDNGEGGTLTSLVRQQSYRPQPL